LTRGIHARSNTPIDVHARTTIIDGWSLISNAAVRIGNDVLEVVNDGSYYINGMKNMEMPLLMSDRFNVSVNEQIIQATNENNEVEQNTEKTFKIELDEKADDYITVTIWKEMIAVRSNTYLIGSEGMFGIYGKVGMVGRDHQTIYDDANSMGAAWQVKDTETMLFHEIRSPQYPMECKLPSEQSRSRRLRENEHLSSRAEKSCAGADEDMVAFCIEDVLLTGDEHVAFAYRTRR
jgi:hypothetical protein